MKNITIFIILGLFLISMTTVQTLTSRSKEQVVLHSTDINSLTNSINKYYTLGYRVISITCQSVGTSINEAPEFYHSNNVNTFRDIKGEILVIMEK